MHYILFKDETIVLFSGSFKSFSNKLRISKELTASISSIGTVDSSKWVCHHKDGERDIEATMRMRRELTV